MDVVYEGFCLTQLFRDVSLEELTNYINYAIGTDPSKFEKGAPEIELFPLPENFWTRSALVKGVLLSLREIEESFYQKKIMGSPPFIRNPYLGVPHDEAGSIKPSHYPSQIRLQQGYGMMTPVDIFHPSISSNFGNFEKLKNTVYIDCCKRELNINKLWDWGMLKFTETRNPFINPFKKLTKSNVKFQNDCTRVQFGYTLESLQAICRWNGDSELHKYGKQPFFCTDSPPNLRCKIEDILGFACDENGFATFLDCAEYCYLGYVPFEVFVRGILYQPKIDRFRYRCEDCLEIVKLFGVDVDANWLAGRCGCRDELLKARGLLHGEEKFVRVVIPVSNRREGEHERDIEGREQQEPGVVDSRMLGVPLMQVLPSTYESVDDFRWRAVPAAMEEHRLAIKELESQRTTAVMVRNRLKETLEVKRKKKDVYMVAAAVPKDKLWCREGLPKIGKLSITSMVDGASVGRPNRGLIFDITSDPAQPNVCILWLELIIPHGEDIRNFQRFAVTPRPPTSVIDGVKAAVATWRKNVQLFNEVYHTYRGSINRLRWVGYGRRSRVNVWIASVELASSPMTSALARHLEFGGFVGMDLKIPVVEDGFRFLFDDFARVISISDDGWNAEFTFVIPLPYTFGDLEHAAEMSFKFWALGVTIDSNASKPSCSGAIPAGAEEEDDEDRLFGEYEDSEDEDDVLRDGDEEEERFRVRPQVQVRDDPVKVAASQGYALCLRLRRPIPPVTENSPLRDLLGNWKGSPIPNVTMGNFLLKGQHKRGNDGVTPIWNLRAPAPRDGKQCLIPDILDSLNESQYEAVMKTMWQRLSVVQGAPGAGKTKTAVAGAFYLSLMERGVIVMCAPSNDASNVIFDSLNRENEEKHLGMNVVRMLAFSQEGNYTREIVGDRWSQYLHLLLEKDEEWQQIINVPTLEQRENHGGVDLLRKTRRDLMTEKNRIAVRLLRDADIIVCTVQGTADQRMIGLKKSLVDDRRDIVGLFCDESSLLSVPYIVSLINLAPRRITVLGDHQQLAPQINSYAARTACMDISWMENLTLTSYVREEDVYTFLRVQYRSEVGIAARTSGYMYGGELVSSDSVQDRDYSLLRAQLQLPEYSQGHTIIYTYSDPEKKPTVISASERRAPMTSSWVNPVEVSITLDIIKHYFQCGIEMSKITVISMYEAHVAALREAIGGMGEEFTDVTISTVDSVQGSENNHVIVNLVRSNPDCNVGFLNDNRRINVSMSRSIDYLHVVGDFSMIRRARPDSITALVKQWKLHDISVVDYHLSPRALAPVRVSEMPFGIFMLCTPL